MAPAKMHRVVGDHPDGAPLQAGQRGHHVGREGRSQLQDRPLVGHQLQCVAHVVHASPILGHHPAQRILVRQSPSGRGRPGSRPDSGGPPPRLLPRRRTEDIDHPVGHLHRDWPHLVGSDHTQASPFDHGGPAHTDGGLWGGDDHVATAEQRCVAREAPPGHHSDQRHPSAELGEEGERLGVEAGHHRGVGVPGPPAATFGEQHHWQAQARGQLEEPVLLPVVHLPLRAGQDGVVVRDDHATRPLAAEQLAVDAGQTGHQPVGRRAGDQVVVAAPGPLGRHDETAVLVEAGGIDQIVDVLAGRAPARVVATRRGLGATGVQGGAHAGTQLGELRTDGRPGGPTGSGFTHRGGISRTHGRS